jgi:hypothetical protein
MRKLVVLFSGIGACFFLISAQNKEESDFQIFKVNFKKLTNAKFKDYAKKAELYITNRFPNSPIKGEYLSDCAQEVYDSLGILIPVEFVLAQAQFESKMGLEGRAPTTNPFNVGEYDAYTAMRFESTIDGVRAYYFLMAKDYLVGKTVDDLLINFVNKRGLRYASNRSYEKVLKQQYEYVKLYINNRI